MTDPQLRNNDGVKGRDTRFLLILAAVAVLVTAAAAPFFGRAAMIVPAILQFCGIH